LWFSRCEDGGYGGDAYFMIAMITMVVKMLIAAMIRGDDDEDIKDGTLHSRLHATISTPTISVLALSCTAGTVNSSHGSSPM
jgi:hypothetical protein